MNLYSTLLEVVSVQLNRLSEPAAALREVVLAAEQVGLPQAQAQALV